MADCPCGSGAELAGCCGPFHARAAAAPTAEALMRSRYSAYALGDEGYLRWSWHPDHCPDELMVGGDEEWLGLRLVATRAGGVADERGVVEFVARFRSGASDHSLHEVSRFVRLDGRWVYLKGRDVSMR
jgi:SEC-C motif domain protein